MSDIPERSSDDIENLGVEIAVTRLLDTTERIASSLERIVALIENSIDEPDEYDEDEDGEDEYDEWVRKL
tara:strand:- start:146 stop:355 length:210 start_codon:yes stop_codon:yes gene_type:complete